MTSEQPRPYHHGNLAEALVAAGLELAAEGGPDAVVLREVARRTGVSATSAYRHFDGQAGLMDAIKDASLDRLADHMREALRAYAEDGSSRPGVPLPDVEPGSAAERGLRRLEAIGRAYFDFALTQPGLFRCFCNGLPMTEAVTMPDPAAAVTDTDGQEQKAAFGVLSDVLDELVEADVLPPERRAAAVDVALWAAVHGLAMLCLEGPLASMGAEVQQHLLDVVLEMAVFGILPR